MPNIKSQKKRVLTAQREAEQNRRLKSMLKTLQKRVSTHASSGESKEGQELSRLLLRRLDQAVAKGVLHKNTVSRRKSQVMKLFSA